MIEWLFVPAAYLIGSISSAIIICRLMGLPDPREQGSGNPGATNVMRIGGKKAAAITLLGDLLKGLHSRLYRQFIGQCLLSYWQSSVWLRLWDIFIRCFLSLKVARAWRHP